jgi:biopolymer transport protein ExbD
MTSLIDVIFLLLLFVMLSSTFSKFGEIELKLGAGSGAATATKERLVLARLTHDGLSINGQETEISGARDRITALQTGAPMHLVLSVTEKATAQTLADTLLMLRGLKSTKLTVVN